MTAAAHYEQQIGELARTCGVRIGASVWTSSMPSPAGYCQQDRFPLASVAKFLTAVAAVKRQEEGEVASAADLSNLVMAAISHHDAAATAALCTICGGIDKVNETLASAGFPSLSVMADNTRPDNAGSPHDLTSLLRQVAEGSLLGADGTGLILRGLAAQSDPDGLLSGLPANAPWHHMTGGLNDVCNDIGILLGDADDVLVCSVLVQGAVPWPMLEETVGRVGRLTYPYWCSRFA